MKTKSTLVAIMFFVCTNLSVTANAQAVNVQDSLALVDLYNSTDGPNWEHKTNWLNGPVSTWFGITVADSRVTVINLPFNKVTGSIPPAIGNLVNLTYLSLGLNHLTGSIPAEIGNLVNLTYLSLEANQLTGSIPAEIGNLVNLTYLSLLGANQLTGSIPAEIGNLVNLTYLSFWANHLTGFIPPEIGNLVNLTGLNLSGNQLSSVPSEIGNLVNLTSLGLSYNQLGSIPPQIGNLVNLTSLYLTHNRLTFDGLEMVAQKFPFAQYSPQANIPLHQNSNSLFVSAGGTLSNNTYNWYKLGNPNPTTIDGDSVFHPSSNGKYYAAVTNSICTLLTLNTDTIDYDATLPVTLINLKALQQGGIVKVNWSSLTETNMERYEVQRSVNANVFSSIGSIAAKGNCTTQQNYSFNDLKPLNGNNYYRLKANDKDGNITCSKIVLVNISGDKTFTIVYPVPAKDILHIQTNGSASFSLINQAGKILLTTNISGNGSMNVGGLASGLYYLKNNSTGVVQKVVITK